MSLDQNPSDPDSFPEPKFGRLEDIDDDNNAIADSNSRSSSLHLIAAPSTSIPNTNHVHQFLNPSTPSSNPTNP